MSKDKRLELPPGFELLTPFTTAGSGTARWCFARKGAQEYFVKEFLSPVYPLEQANFSPVAYAQRMDACWRFEKAKRRLYDTLSRADTGGIATVECFFLQGSKFTAISKRVAAADDTLDTMALLTMENRLILMRFLVYSLLRLSESGFVHGDLKDTNLLLEPRADGFYTIKLIDFDGGFFIDTPPQMNDEVFGDPVYLAPESLLCMMGEKVALTEKLDVFALGLLFHQFLSGRMPSFDTTSYAYAHEAVLDGAPLTLSDTIDPALGGLILRMLRRAPEERPDYQTIFGCLGGRGLSAGAVR